MVQFSAIAYSPRLVHWIVRDRVLWHSLGVFTATFLYALGAIAWLDRNHSGNSPFFSGWLVIVLMLASVAMLVALVDRYLYVPGPANAQSHRGSWEACDRDNVYIAGGPDDYPEYRRTPAISPDPNCVSPWTAARDPMVR